MDQVGSIDILFLSWGDGVCLVSPILHGQETMGHFLELSLPDAANCCGGDNRNA